MPPKLTALIFFIITVSINLFAANLLDNRAKAIFEQQQLVLLKETALVAAASITEKEHSDILDAAAKGGYTSASEARAEDRLRKFLDSAIVDNVLTMIEIHGSVHYVLDARPLEKSESPLDVYKEYQSDAELLGALKKRIATVTPQPRLVRGKVVYTAYAPLDSEKPAVVAVDMTEEAFLSTYLPMRSAIISTSFIMTGLAGMTAMFLFWALSLVKRLSQKRNHNEDHK
jgi:hypothetical protein